MQKSDPVQLIVIGIVLFIIGHFAPNGVSITNAVELIVLINFATTVCEGLGIGLVIGGAVLLVKNKKK